jgi:hypothetical protein
MSGHPRAARRTRFGARAWRLQRTLERQIARALAGAGGGGRHPRQVATVSLSRASVAARHQLAGAPGTSVWDDARPRIDDRAQWIV